jgi:hypothetical protein
MIRLKVSIKQASLQFEPPLSLSVLSSLLKRPSVVQFHATFTVPEHGSTTFLKELVQVQKTNFGIYGYLDFTFLIVNFTKINLSL